jgi:signal transduction histidine kinase
VIVEETRRVVRAAEWGALTVGLLLAARQHADATTLAGCGVLVVMTATQGLDGERSARAFVPLALVPVSVVAVTGGQASPLLPAVIPPILATGLRYGSRPTFALVAVTLVGLSRLSPDVQVAAWAVELVLLGLVGAYVHRMQRVSPALADLQTANRLLVELATMTRAVPVTTDLDESMRGTAAHLRELLRADEVDLVIGDERASVGHSRADDVVSVDLLDGNGAPVGTLTLARAEPLTAAERSVLESAAAHAALVLDNARRLRQIRVLAAGEERRRIARDLHDHLGQELAGLGYHLDRAAAVGPDEASVAIAAAREAVRCVVAQLRGALADLRSDAVDRAGIARALAVFAGRVEERSDLKIELDTVRAPALPSAVERELLHIAQEAVVNAERHARATRVTVRLTEADGAAVLDVVDDGCGLADAATPFGHFGRLGMEERAKGMGGALTVRSDPASGTSVHCEVPL